MPDYASMCLDMLEYAYIFLNNSTFYDCNPLSDRKRDYLFQCLRKTISYSLKEHEAVFLMRQNGGWKYLI